MGNLTGDYSHRRHDNLTEVGWAQARALAAGWDQGFALYVASSLSRARQTLLPTLQRFDRKAEVWPDLAECCWQEPRSLAPSEPELPGVCLDWGEDEARWFAHQGPLVTPSDDERWQDGVRRMRRAAQRLADVGRDRDVLAVSHGYAISKLVMLLTGNGDLNDVYDIDNAAATWLEPSAEGPWVVTRFNQR